MSRLDDLANNYEKHISAPWQRNLAGAQRSIFVVYPQEDERRIRAKIKDLKSAHAMLVMIGNSST